MKKYFQPCVLNPVSRLSMPKTLILLLCMVLSSIVPYASADIWDELKGHDDKVLEYDASQYEFEEHAWKEGKIRLPDYPVESDLVAIDGSSAYQNYQYLIDVKHLRADPDGVVRYTMVIIAPSGSKNVIFEGLRCNSGEYRTYAYGNSGRFIKKKSVTWRRLSSQSVLGYTKNLAEAYFCDHLGETLKQHEIVQNLRYGKGSVDGFYIE